MTTLHVVTAFLPAILRSPDDDTPRLVAADAIEEAGDVEWAEVIRAAVTGDKSRVRPSEIGVWVALTERFPEGILSTWRRGFVDRVACTMETWLRHGGEICKLHPVMQVVISDRRPYRHRMEIFDPERFTWWDEDFEKQRKEPHGILLADSTGNIPGEIFDLIAAELNKTIHDTFYHRSMGFLAEKAANEALSLACLIWARRQAGLADRYDGASEAPPS